MPAGSCWAPWAESNKNMIQPKRRSNAPSCGWNTTNDISFQVFFFYLTFSKYSLSVRFSNEANLRTSLMRFGTNRQQRNHFCRRGNSEKSFCIVHCCCLWLNSLPRGLQVPPGSWHQLLLRNNDAFTSDQLRRSISLFCSNSWWFMVIQDSMVHRYHF